MKLKKRIAPMLAGLLAAVVAVTSTASAHIYDFWVGKYIGMSGAKITLKIMNSAQTGFLTKDTVYKYATNWNGISSNVKISVVYETPGMSTTPGQMSVVGVELKKEILGCTIPYDANGKPLDDSIGLRSDWAYVQIGMNTNPFAFSGGVILDPVKTIINARKTFIHEVGHALKLSHPEPYAGGHDKIGGLPYAIMNQGFAYPSSDTVAADITPHDKGCLIQKWGS